MQHTSHLESLFIEHVEQGQWTPPKRWPDCYELILIQAGEGYYLINGNQVAYRPGDVFFLGTQDKYSFSMTQRSSFYRLAFSRFFVDSLPARGSYSWECLSQSTAFHLGSIAADVADQDKLRTLAVMLLAEKQSIRSDNFIIESLMTVILSLVSRLLDQQGLSSALQLSLSSDLTRRVIAYINQHIGEPHRLRMEVIADVFHYSPSHLSALFKQQVGDSIQQFIIRHKLKLVARRLRYTSLTISQVADEFGFSDVCHLNKLFKRHYNHTPTTYRQGLFA
ncbi:helix-turn-helix domain-containing protein [Spirosoma knui]